jgi:hypothetical protein
MKSLSNLKKMLIAVLLIHSAIIGRAQTFNPTFSISSSGSVNNFAGGYTFAYAVSGSPWNGALMSFGGFGNTYDCQISTDYGPSGGNHLSFRTRNGDAAAWNSWYELYHSGNFNNANTDFNAKNIIANGKVGIGTTSPQAPLDVSGNLILRNYQNIKGAGATMIFTPYGDDFLHGPRIKSYLDNAEGAASAARLVLSSYWQGYKDELTLVNGKVGIGTYDPDATLAVNGTIHAKEVKVDLNVPGPDYVFNTDYKLTGLGELKAYIEKNHHLPEVPSADEMAKNGLSLGEMNTKLLKKVEELTLYLIEMKSEINALKKKTSQ